MSQGGCDMVKNTLFLAAFAVAVFRPLVARAAVTAKGLSDEFVRVAEEIKPSVVSIRVEARAAQTGLDPRMEEFFRRFGGMPGFPGDRGARPRLGIGSGVIVDAEGHILTNNHVIREAEEITVVLSDGREFEAKVVGRDAKTDVAVIKIDARNLRPAKLGDSDELRVGEIVLAVGNPFGLDSTVTSGIVSAKGRARLRVADYEDFIQTDAAINPGNSGGPLVDLDAEVVGINTLILSRSGGYQGIGLAIPVNMARGVMNELIRSGKVVRGWLGVIIQDLTPKLAKAMGLRAKEGVLVVQVAEGAPAAKAGLRERDVIVEYQGRRIRDVNDLRNRVAQTSPGTAARLEALRGGKKVAITVKIGELPEEMTGFGSPETKSLGMNVEELTPQLARRHGLRRAEGLVVTELERGGPAERGGIQEGDLLVEAGKKRVSTLEEFREAVEHSGKDVLLLVRRGNFAHYVVVSKR